jgi:hypothetical protein
MMYVTKFSSFKESGGLYLFTVIIKSISLLILFLDCALYEFWFSF